MQRKRKCGRRSCREPRSGRSLCRSGKQEASLGAQAERELVEVGWKISSVVLCALFRLMIPCLCTSLKGNRVGPSPSISFCCRLPRTRSNGQNEESGPAPGQTALNWRHSASRGGLVGQERWLGRAIGTSGAGEHFPLGLECARVAARRGSIILIHRTIGRGGATHRSQVLSHELRCAGGGPPSRFGGGGPEEPPR